MNTLVKRLNIWEYDRISITTDSKSECATDILYDRIKDIMNKEIPQRIGLMKPGAEIHYIDELNELFNYSSKKDFNDTVIKKIRNGDAFLYRGKSWVSMNGGFKGVPSQLVYMSEMVFTVLDNKLTVIKDRYRDPSDFQDIDLKPYLVSTKITKILNRING